MLNKHEMRDLAVIVVYLANFVFAILVGVLTHNGVMKVVVETRAKLIRLTAINRHVRSKGGGA